MLTTLELKKHDTGIPMVYRQYRSDTIFNFIKVKSFNSPKFQEHYLSDGKPKV